ncbi:DUF190 domain-containing protein [Methylorubrum extorquens]|jgi:PII-like signaling protein|uniref:Uncharacterized protein n=1 Tax=Methylorubrum extorquens (strain ATCC 14718 / DSM 1338 / JCM 2805 / NCIMB 9133 / AM1) TaxID=272630 RepID=C5AY27_METEA|nr:DUF190 domain-containing protein [Methylorubrum extorquens]ACS39080.1 conserved hypothetical protein [Methylorubrum extorquens AM1]MCP1542814.1 PII-like signaling protein [Methylorubrum extorquens]MCP1589841.1 PII-like signaling protein [Methylorubrum extorquens]
MTPSHHVVAAETGMIRIYLKPRDRAGTGRTGWFSGGKPLYRELVAQAKAEGLINAVAHHAHHGYSNHGPVLDDGAESVNPELTMCVELIGGREQLERFCARYGAQLSGKVIVYKHLEHWTLGPIDRGPGGGHRAAAGV